ncbi:MAG: acetyl-CoA carboxylase biotin carboxyl carrier protein [Ruminiclostridium sp.]
MQFETNSLTDAVKEFIGIMKDSGLSYMYVKNDKFEIELGQKNPPPAPPMMSAMPPMAMATAPTAPTAAEQTAPAAAPADTGKSIKSPIVGTFYSAPSPTKPPFVKVGDKVNEGDTVCIVESMKVMNEIQADISGTVKSIAVKDGEAVEFGQPLIIIE